jgi:hypothetical protein
LPDASLAQPMDGDSSIPVPGRLTGAARQL